MRLLSFLKINSWRSSATKTVRFFGEKPSGSGPGAGGGGGSGTGKKPCNEAQRSAKEGNSKTSAAAEVITQGSGDSAANMVSTSTPEATQAPKDKTEIKKSKLSHLKVTDPMTFVKNELANKQLDDLDITKLTLDAIKKDPNIPKPSSELSAPKASVAGLTNEITPAVPRVANAVAMTASNQGGSVNTGHGAAMSADVTGVKNDSNTTTGIANSGGNTPPGDPVNQPQMGDVCEGPGGKAPTMDSTVKDNIVAKKDSGCKKEDPCKKKKEDPCKKKKEDPCKKKKEDPCKKKKEDPCKKKKEDPCKKKKEDPCKKKKKPKCPPKKDPCKKKKDPCKKKKKDPCKKKKKDPCKKKEKPKCPPKKDPCKKKKKDPCKKKEKPKCPPKKKDPCKEKKPKCPPKKKDPCKKKKEDPCKKKEKPKCPPKKEDPCKKKKKPKCPPKKKDPCKKKKKDPCKKKKKDPCKKKKKDPCKKEPKCPEPKPKCEEKKKKSVCKKRKPKIRPVKKPPICKPKKKVCKRPPPKICSEANFWRKLSLFAGLPLILLLTGLVFSTKEEHERPEFVPYTHLRLRNKPFPWGDGNHSLFHNRHLNALPEGYEDEIEDDGSDEAAESAAEAKHKEAKNVQYLQDKNKLDADAEDQDEEDSAEDDAHAQAEAKHAAEAAVAAARDEKEH